jgi:hypothetical protein
MQLHNMEGSVAAFTVLQRAKMRLHNKALTQEKTKQVGDEEKPTSFVKS